MVVETMESIWPPFAVILCNLLRKIVITMEITMVPKRLLRTTKNLEGQCGAKFYQQMKKEFKKCVKKMRKKNLKI